MIAEMLTWKDTSVKSIGRFLLDFGARIVLQLPLRTRHLIQSNPAA